MTQPTRTQAADHGTTFAVAAMVTLVALAAGIALYAGSDTLGSVARAHGGDLAAFFVATLVLQALSLKGFASSVSVSGLGMLAVGFTFGVGPAMATAFLTAAVHVVRRRPKIHKALFNAACWTLATGAAVGLYQVLGGPHDATGPRIALSVLASCVFLAVNVGLLTIAMSVAEQRPALETWKARLRWISPTYITFGPLALVAALCYPHGGLTGVGALLGTSALLLAALRRTLPARAA
jgi:hypothetical protein